MSVPLDWRMRIIEERKDELSGQMQEIYDEANEVMECGEAIIDMIYYSLPDLTDKKVKE